MLTEAEVIKLKHFYNFFSSGGLIALVEDNHSMYLSKQFCNLVKMEEPIAIGESILSN